jgi:hypothetical protein
VAAVGALAAFAIGAPLAAALLGFDYVIQRNLIIALPPLAIALGAGLVSRRVIWPGLAVLVAIAGFSVASIDKVARTPVLHKPEWREVAAALGAQDPGRAIVTGWDGIPTLEAHRDVSPIGARVEQIDYVLAWGQEVTPPPGFTEVGRQLVGSRFLLIRYRAARPRAVDGERLLDERAYLPFGGFAVLDRPDGATSR